MARVCCASFQSQFLDVCVLLLLVHNRFSVFVFRFFALLLIVAAATIVSYLCRILQNLHTHLCNMDVCATKRTKISSSLIFYSSTRLVHCCVNPSKHNFLVLPYNSRFSIFLILPISLFSLLFLLLCRRHRLHVEYLFVADFVNAFQHRHGV